MKRRAVVTATVIAVTSAGASAQTGTIAGRVHVAGTELPVNYAIVSTTPGGRELFTDGDGQFVIRGVPAGPVRITARRVGFAPVDTTIAVTRDDTARVQIGLSLITIRLPPVYALAKACAHPGGSDAQIGVELMALFDQLRENAVRNRLLSQSYPFELEVERRITRPEPTLEARFVAYDTVVRASERKWRYAPGKMLGTREYPGGVFAGKWTTITMPELADFADERFLINHCFDFGGLELVEGDSLIRIDFTPAPVVHDLDVAGTLFLDRVSYQLRLTDISVVNLTKQLRGQMGGQSIRAYFREVIPGVPIVHAVSSIVYPKDDPKHPDQEPSTEHHRVLSVKFLRGRP